MELEVAFPIRSKEKLQIVAGKPLIEKKQRFNQNVPRFSTETNQNHAFSSSGPILHSQKAGGLVLKISSFGGRKIRAKSNSK